MHRPLLRRNDNIALHKFQQISILRISGGRPLEAGFGGRDAAVYAERMKELKD